MKFQQKSNKKSKFYYKYYCSKEMKFQQKSDKKSKFHYKYYHSKVLTNESILKV